MISYFAVPHNFGSCGDALREVPPARGRKDATPPFLKPVEDILSYCAPCQLIESVVSTVKTRYENVLGTGQY